MSDTTQKPKLESALEDLINVGRQLRETSQAYQQMKTLLQQAQADPSQINAEQFGLVMTIPGTTFQVPVPMTGNAEQVLTAIESGAAALGEQIVELWAAAHQITTEANTHCQAAAQAAEQQAEEGGN